MNTTFAAAATSFADLVREIPADAWDGPGPGEWAQGELALFTLTGRRPLPPSFSIV